MAKDYKEKYQGKEKIREEIPIEDLVVGEYYYCNDLDHNIQMIFIYDGRKHLPSPHRVNKIEGGDEDRILTKNHLVIEQSLYKKEGSLWYTGRGGRLASAREKMWLNMCIAKNEFIKRPNDEDIDKFVSSSFKIADTEVRQSFLTYEQTIKKDQNELVYDDFYQGQKFVCYIEGKYCEGLVTIEDEYVYLCQDKVVGAECDNKQGFKYSYTISNDRRTIDDGELDGVRVKDLFLEKPKGTKLESEKIEKIASAINKEILNTVIKMGMVPSIKYLDKPQSELTPADFHTGQRFEGTIRSSFCKGKVYVDEYTKRIYLCQDEENGDDCKDKQGFKYSYIIYLGPGYKMFESKAIKVSGLKIEKPWTVELQSGIEGIENTVLGVAFGGMNMSSGEVFPPSEFSVYLSDPGMAKLGVVKTVKDYTGLGLKEAKDLVDISGPFSDDTLLKEGMSKEAAEEFKKKLEDAGATARVERKVLLPNATRVYATLSNDFDSKIKWSQPTKYFAVLDLEDKADDRLFNNYMEDLSFIGFSKLGGHPIFKVRDNDLTPEELFDKVFSKIVSELKASLMPIDEEELDYHLEENDMPVK